MDIVKIAVMALVAGIFAIIVRQKQPEIAMQITVACGVIIVIYILGYMSEVINFFDQSMGKLNLELNALSAVIKIIGIAYICEFSAQTLKDINETSLALKVELAGRVIIVVLILPMFNNFLELILKLTVSA